MAPVESGKDSPVKLANDFEIEAYNTQDAPEGRVGKFSDLFESGRPVVLNYWAGLCPPCRAKMPDIQEIYGEYQDKVAIFGLDIGLFVGLGSSGDGKALLKQLGVTYPAGTTRDPKILREHPPIGMPTTLFITPDGKVLKRWTGLITKGKLVELIGELVEASTGGAG